MKEVPKKDEPEVSGGVSPPTGFRNGLISPQYPVVPYPTDPCIPMPEDPIKYLQK